MLTRPPRPIQLVRHNHLQPRRRRRAKDRRRAAGPGAAAAHEKRLQVRPRGTGHSWNDAIATAGLSLDTRQLGPSDRPIATRTGCTEPRRHPLSPAHRLAGDEPGRLLAHRPGPRLPATTQGPAPDITLSGFTANGCHGTGWQQPTIAELVYGVQLVGPDGALLDFDKPPYPPRCATSASAPPSSCRSSGSTSAPSACSPRSPSSSPASRSTCAPATSSRQAHPVPRSQRPRQAQGPDRAAQLRRAVLVPLQQLEVERRRPHPARPRDRHPVGDDLQSHRGQTDRHQPPHQAVERRHGRARRRRRGQRLGRLAPPQRRPRPLQLRPHQHEVEKPLQQRRRVQAARRLPLPEALLQELPRPQVHHPHARRPGLRQRRRRLLAAGRPHGGLARQQRPTLPDQPERARPLHPQQPGPALARPRPRRLAHAHLLHRIPQLLLRPPHHQLRQLQQGLLQPGPRRRLEALPAGSPN